MRGIISLKRDKRSNENNLITLRNKNWVICKVNYSLY